MDSISATSAQSVRVLASLPVWQDEANWELSTDVTPEVPTSDSPVRPPGNPDEPPPPSTLISTTTITPMIPRPPPPAARPPSPNPPPPPDRASSTTEVSSWASSLYCMAGTPRSSTAIARAAGPQRQRRGVMPDKYGS